MTEQRKHEMYLWGGVIGGVVILYVVFVPHQVASVNTGNRKSVPNRTPPQKPTMVPNPQQGSLDAAFIQARETAIEAFDATVLGEKTAQDQLIAMNNETQAQKVIAFNQDSTAVKMATIEGTTARDVAGTQASAAENIASQQASALGQAEHSQQQQSFWGGIMGFFQQAFSFLGFNNPYFNPVSYGSATVDASNPDTYDSIFNAPPPDFTTFNPLPELPFPSTVNTGG